eukprot:365397-Chlamydomonas_euryale.AAC.4
MRAGRVVARAAVRWRRTSRTRSSTRRQKASGRCGLRARPSTAPCRAMWMRCLAGGLFTYTPPLPLHPCRSRTNPRPSTFTQKVPPQPAGLIRGHFFRTPQGVEKGGDLIPCPASTPQGVEKGET